MVVFENETFWGDLKFFNLISKLQYICCIFENIRGRSKLLSKYTNILKYLLINKIIKHNSNK